MGREGIIKFYSIDLNNIDTNDILDILKYLKKRTQKRIYTIIFGLIKKIFIGLLFSLLNGSNHTK